MDSLIVAIIIVVGIVGISLLGYWCFLSCKSDARTSYEPSQPYPGTSNRNEPKFRAREDQHSKDHASGSHYVHVDRWNGQRSQAPIRPQQGNRIRTPAPIRPQQGNRIRSQAPERPQQDNRIVTQAPIRPQQGNRIRTPAPFCSITVPTQSETDLDEVARQSKKEADVVKLKLMRELQAKLHSKKFTANDLGFNLLIGVDANPARIGGYCVHLTDFNHPKLSSWAETYTFKSSKLPWNLNDNSRKVDSSEFEMKNLLFALLLWQHQIVEATRFAIYTDNSAIYQRKSEYANRVWGLLNHLKKCKGAVLCNKKSMHSSSKQNQEHFARCIQPADDLSRWKVWEAESFLSKMYGVQISRRSHVVASSMPSKNSRSQQGKVWHNKTAAYNEMLEEVKEAVKEYQVPCQFCHFCIEDTGSLESIAISIC